MSLSRAAISVHSCIMEQSSSDQVLDATMTTGLLHHKHSKVPPHPWEVEPVYKTIAREAPHMWPFAVGFLVTGYLIYKISSTVTDEDLRNSNFSNPKKH